MQNQPYPHTCFRCYRICSPPFFIESIQNGYPVGITNYNITDVLRRQQQNAERPTTVPKNIIYIVLPYMGLRSNVIARVLKFCISKFYGCIDLRVLFNSTRNITSFFPYKDRLDILCPKLSIKLNAGNVINFTLVRRCSVFPNFRFF